MKNGGLVSVLKACTFKGGVGGWQNSVRIWQMSGLDKLAGSNCVCLCSCTVAVCFSDMLKSGPPVSGMLIMQILYNHFCCQVLSVDGCFYPLLAFIYHLQWGCIHLCSLIQHPLFFSSQQPQDDGESDPPDLHRRRSQHRPLPFAPTAASLRQRRHRHSHSGGWVPGPRTAADPVGEQQRAIRSPEDFECSPGQRAVAGGLQPHHCRHCGVVGTAGGQAGRGRSRQCEKVAKALRW